MIHPIRADYNLKMYVVDVPAEVTIEDALETLLKIEEMSGENGFNKVILDMRNVVTLPEVEEMYEIASGFPSILWLAILVTGPGKIKEKLEFGETVSKNRGRMVRIFSSEDEATEWLHKN